MAATGLRSEERIGLGIALAAHAGLVALLVWRPPTPAMIAPPERIEVTLSDDAGLTSTSPETPAQAAPDTAPELGEQPPPAPEPEAAAEPLPAPQPVVRPQPKPEPRLQPRPEPPKPVAKAVPRPVPKPVPRPVATPRPVAQPVAKPAPRPPATRQSPIEARIAASTARQSPRPAARPSGAATTARPTTTPGGSRIGSDFLKGVPNATAQGPARAAPAATIGPAVRSSLASAISRQLKPKWVAPQGVDAELLVTVLAFDLNADGTLAGRPRVVRQEGINDANRAQAARHAEQAVRAVQLAAPFDLPAQYYDAWKRVTSFRFDRRLSQ
jgi:outer membrane biosynthesis protein TonB